MSDNSADAKQPKVIQGSATARAEYLEKAYELIRAKLLPEAPELSKVALAFSFPTRGATTGKVIGQCHYLTDAAQKKNEAKGSGESHLILIAPKVWERTDVEVLATLAHEMAHAALPKHTGHRKPFAKMVERIGLEGKATATVAGPLFKNQVCVFRLTLPAFPGGPVLTFKQKKQTTRLRLWECPCGVKARVASDEFKATCGRCKQKFEDMSEGERWRPMKSDGQRGSRSCSTPSRETPGNARRWRTVSRPRPITCARR